MFSTHVFLNTIILCLAVPSVAEYTAYYIFLVLYVSDNYWKYISKQSSKNILYAEETAIEYSRD